MWVLQTTPQKGMLIQHLCLPHPPSTASDFYRDLHISQVSFTLLLIKNRDFFCPKLPCMAFSSTTMHGLVYSWILHVTVSESVSAAVPATGSTVAANMAWQLGHQRYDCFTAITNTVRLHWHLCCNIYKQCESLYDLGLICHSGTDDPALLHCTSLPVHVIIVAN